MIINNLNADIIVGAPGLSKYGFELFGTTIKLNDIEVQALESTNSISSLNICTPIDLITERVVIVPDNNQGGVTVVSLGMEINALWPCKRIQLLIDLKNQNESFTSQIQYMLGIFEPSV